MLIHWIPIHLEEWKVYNLQTHTFHTSRDIFLYEYTYTLLQAPNPPSINNNKYTSKYYSDDKELHPPQTKIVPSLAVIPLPMHKKLSLH